MIANLWEIIVRFFTFLVTAISWVGVALYVIVVLGGVVWLLFIGIPTLIRYFFESPEGRKKMKEEDEEKRRRNPTSGF